MDDDEVPVRRVAERGEITNVRVHLSFLPIQRAVVGSNEPVQRGHPVEQENSVHPVESS